MLRNAETIKTCANQINLWLPIITFILGGLLTRFTMSASERFSAKHVKFQLAKELGQAQNTAFLELTSALKHYAASSGKPSLDDFLQISTKSHTYLYHQKVIADAILSNKVDEVSRDQTLVPSLIETAVMTIPDIYETLKYIANKNGLPYPSEFERRNYQSIYDVVDRYAHSNGLIARTATTAGA